MFGSVENATALRPSGEDVRLKVMIEQGAQLAAMNAVKTCQRVTDNCLVSACLNNPWRCVEGTSMKKISAADFVGSLQDVANQNTKTSTINYKKDEKGNFVLDANNNKILTSDMDLYALTGSDIRKNLKAQCLETIGTNKYCHMTYREKSPNNKDLMDIDLQEDVFSLAYAARKEMVNTKIQEELKKFDTKAKEACVETIASCAMRSCGGGIGSVCYTEAHTNEGIAINGTNTYGDIKSACAAIVNTDPNCIYAATASDGYEYAYINKTTFDKLFTDDKTPETSADPIGAVAYLNSLLATSYNDAAIEKMKTQCRTTALSCVRSMCGKDFVNCYRNRTDIISGSYNTGTDLDKSMNKMGGILDYNIVMGLCMNTVTTSSVCDEHLKIAASSLRKMSDTQSWGSNNSVRSAWMDANATNAKLSSNSVVVNCSSQSVILDSDNSYVNLCSGLTDACGTVDENGCVFDKENTVSVSEYLLSESATTLFQQLLVDVEKEVQAKYNAKLTKEQNVCLANNNGGIMGASENGSTFMWVKLNSNKVPKTYNMKGLTTKQFKASNDLYGSFCRARITVTSDDKLIQESLGDKATAYFAVGDTFTCGSWIDEKTLNSITEKVGNRELCKQGYGKWDEKKGKCSGLSTKEKIAYAWGTVAPALAGTGIGIGLTESGVLGNWLNKGNGDLTQKQRKNSCISQADRAITYAADWDNTKDSATKALESASELCNEVTKSKDCDITSGTDDANANAVKNAARAIKAACEDASDTIGPGNQKNSAMRSVVPIMTTLAAGGLGAGITASVIAAKKEDIKNKAVAEWMENIGEHIQCFVGTDELGSYGDTIAIEID